MIKLIVTDMDGTLLNPFQKVGKEFEFILDELDKRGIVFALASGRNNHRIRNVFRKDLDVVYISDNGGHIEYRNKLISKTTMCKDTLVELVDFLKNKSYCRFAISDRDCNYVDNKAAHKMGKYLKFETSLVNDIKSCINLNEITKCSVLVNPCYQKKLLKELQEKFLNLNIVSSSSSSIDITDMKADKVNAVEILREKYKINEDNVMVFGNHINDYKMLKKYNHSFAVANAHKDIKEISNHIIPSNLKNGVLNTIKERVLA